MHAVRIRHRSSKPSRAAGLVLMPWHGLCLALLKRRALYTHTTASSRCALKACCLSVENASLILRAAKISHPGQ